MRLFLSYHFDDEAFVQRVNYYLRKQQSFQTFYYPEDGGKKSWPTEVSEQLVSSDVFVLFIGEQIGRTQRKEAEMALDRHLNPPEGTVACKLRTVFLPEAVSLPNEFNLFRPEPHYRVPNLEPQAIYSCAKWIAQSLEESWISVDDLPVGYQFDYEKTIIEEYGRGRLTDQRIANGCAPIWPTVLKISGDKVNPVPAEVIGLYRDWDDQNKKQRENPQIFASASMDYQPYKMDGPRLTFPEAGPHKYLRYPINNHDAFRVGVMVSGGIAPGINAVIEGIVRRHSLYAEHGKYEKELHINGYYDGLIALMEGGPRFIELTKESVRFQATQGGSLLGASRVTDYLLPDPSKVEEALKEASSRLHLDRVQILYIIGGDGSMRAAHALQTTVREMGYDISIVGIPKTMDNDILWVWQSFGFLSAVEWANDAIRQLHTEAQSNPRLCVIQLFGSDSGFVVTHAVSASEVCDLFLIPEVPFTLKRVVEYIRGKLQEKMHESGKRQSAHAVVVMAETAIPLDAEDYLDDPEVGLTEAEKLAIRKFALEHRRVFGQTPNELRDGGLKLVSRVIQKEIRHLETSYFKKFRVFTNEPRHLIRSIAPSGSDVIFGQRLGGLAVDCAMAGYRDFMVSQWLTEYVMVPLKLVTLGRKRIPTDGVFFKSALASTGQPADLT